MNILEQISDFKITMQLWEDKLEEGKLNNYRHEVWYTFKPKKTGSYEIVCTGSEKLSVYIYDEEIRNYYNNIYKVNETAIHLAGTLMDSGIYYVKISFPQYVQGGIDYKILVTKVEEPSVCYLEDQWGILNKTSGLDINILPVWKYTKGNAFKIGIADSGIFYEHFELRKKINLGLSNNFVHGIKETFPQNELYSKASAVGGHGTHVAGIIVSQKKLLE